MSNYFPSTTGLPVVVWVSPKYGSKGLFRIKVGQSRDTVIYNHQGQNVSWPVGYKPKDREQVNTWVASYITILLQHWNFELDGVGITDALRAAGAVK